MKRIIFSGLLAVAATVGVLLTAQSAEAQRGRGGSGGSRGGSHYGGYSHGNTHGYSHGYSHQGYHNFYPGFSGSFGPNYYGRYSSPYWGRSYGYYNYGGYSPSYYYAAPDSESFAAPANDMTVHVLVRVPMPDAEIWFAGDKTQQTGVTREFQSPPIESGRTFTYEIRARWKENGREVNQTRSVKVQAGQWLTVDFNNPAPQQP